MDEVQQMSLLSRCNHSITTVGSFGFWSSYLADGEVVYPDIKVDKQYHFRKEVYEKAKLKNFTPLPIYKIYL